MADGKINVYSLKGKVVGSVELPPAFSTEYRPDLIRKAVSAMEANIRQPYGASKGAGMRHAVSTWGKGRGVARVQRLSQGAKGAQSPGTVGGRRAHPPYAERDWSKKMNRKEGAKARLSALGALADGERVRDRGHRFSEELTVPVVVEDDIEKISRTQEVVEVLESIGIGTDVTRATDGRKTRAGRGKMRGRKYRTPKSILIVVSDKEAPLFEGAGNLPGVDIVAAESVNIGMLAPGGDAGRLAMFSESALKKIGEW
ncbi:MAG: 50S ribosomal protein L4 [Euryarchaeota archaeon]|nr:50S ribosomal protein L4 [Euryarchaeota archaeon]